MNLDPSTEQPEKSIAETQQRSDPSAPSPRQKARPQKESKPNRAQETVLATYATIVIGAGISGIAAAYKLREKGYEDFIVLEKASRVGGTWRDNNYPGCGCDVPSALYSFSFAPSHKWSYLFAKQPEILNYLEEVVEQYQLREKIQLNHELLSAHWDPQQCVWKLKTSRGLYYARSVIFSTGPITEPALPKLKGIETFKGGDVSFSTLES